MTSSRCLPDTEKDGITTGWSGDLPAGRGERRGGLGLTRGGNFSRLGESILLTNDSGERA